MIKTRLAIMIASFAFSTAAMASSSTTYIGDGTKADNVPASTCPLLAAKGGDSLFANAQKDADKARAAVNGRAKEVKTATIQKVQHD